MNNLNKAVQYEMDYWGSVGTGVEMATRFVFETHALAMAVRCSRINQEQLLTVVVVVRRWKRARAQQRKLLTNLLMVQRAIWSPRPPSGWVVEVVVWSEGVLPAVVVPSHSTWAALAAKAAAQN